MHAVEQLNQEIVIPAHPSAITTLSPPAANQPPEGPPTPHQARRIPRRGTPGFLPKRGTCCAWPARSSTRRGCTYAESQSPIPSCHLSRECNRRSRKNRSSPRHTVTAFPAAAAFPTPANTRRRAISSRYSARPNPALLAMGSLPQPEWRSTLLQRPRCVWQPPLLQRTPHP